MMSDTRDLFNGHLRDLGALLDLFSKHVTAHREMGWLADAILDAIDEAQLALARVGCRDCWEGHGRLRLPAGVGVYGDLCDDCYDATLARAVEGRF